MVSLSTSTVHRRGGGSGSGSGSKRVEGRLSLLSRLENFNVLSLAWILFAGG